MIRILYISVGEGGSDQALITLLKQLKQNLSISPLVVLRKQATATTLKQLSAEGIPFRLFDFDFFWYPQKKYPWRYLSRLQMTRKMKKQNQVMTQAIIELANEYKIQLIHTNSSAFQFGLEAAQALQIPHIWHLREYQSLDFGKSHAYSLDYIKKRMNRIGNFNIAITKGIYTFYQLKDENSTVIYDGINLPQQIQESSRKPFYLFAGRIVKEKGVYVLLNSFVRYMQAGGSYHLYFAGSYKSKTKKKLDQQISKQSLTDKIHFVGPIETEELYRLMQTASATIVPSQFEAFGLVTAEAMLNKCLLIGRDTGGTKEQFDNGFQECGEEIALRFHSEKELTELLMEVENSNIEILQKMKLRGFKVASSLYSIERNVAQVTQLYQKVLQKK